MSTIKSDTLDQLRGQNLTKVIVHKPNAQDVDRWEDELSKMATLITARSIPGGLELGLLSTVISEEEYQLEIEDENYEYNEPTDPGSYPELDGDEDDITVKRLEAEHKTKQDDFLKFTAFKQYVQKQFGQCIDATWIEPLQRNRTGYAHVSPKQFLEHLRTDVAKLSTKEKNELKKQVYIDWNQPEDIETFFKRMEDLEWQVEKWDVTIDAQDMVNHAVLQMQDSNMFEVKFLRDWEEKPDNTKSWNAMKTYFTAEYWSIKKYQPNKQAFESINNVEEGEDISTFFDEFRREAISSKDQIQQMALSFQGATTTMAEIMERLKTAMATIETQNKTITNLTETNKQLMSNNTKLTSALAAMGGKAPPNKKEATAGGKDAKAMTEEERVETTNPQKHVCSICKQVHAKPFREWCLEIEANKSKRPAGWKSKL
jgi:regulator of replication initiation timing